MSGRQTGIVAGFIATIAVVGLAAVSGLRGTIDRSGAMTGAESLPQIAAPAPQLDLQKDGPFGGGERVGLSEAESISGFSLPPAPETEATESLTAIWINESRTQVAYVWGSDLRLYISRLEVDPGFVAAAWEAKAAEPGSAFDIVPLSFGDGIGAPARGTNPSSLLWLRHGYEFQLVGPEQTLDQLVELAESLEVG